LVKQAVEFEDAYVVGVLGMKTNERIIKDWADGVSGHYERKRRMEILGHARDVIVRDQKMKTFTVEVEHMHQIAPEQAKVNVKKEETLMEEVDQAWGFDDDEDKADDGEGEADGWGFDDDVEPEQENPSEDEQHEEDPSDAWGWNDNDPSAGQRPVDSSFVAERETYLVSLHTRQTLAIVADVLREGNEFASSSMFSSVPLLSLPSPGAVLLQSASAVVDLFRALSPIHLGKGHVGLAKAMQFSNDCLYLSGELAKLSSDEKLVECKEKLKILGDSWFDDTIVGNISSLLSVSFFDCFLQEKQRRSVDGILVTVEGFTYTTEQDRYDECEDALGRVVRDIRAVARLWEVRLVLASTQIPH
jgi:centromere/kinetochore protein ZW10